MTKYLISTITALTVSFLVIGPAFAEGGGENSNRGLPEVSSIGTVAPGQPSYVLDSQGHLVDRRQIDAPQTAASAN
jgi:hypothetical protein